MERGGREAQLKHCNRGGWVSKGMGGMGRGGNRRTGKPAQVTHLGDSRRQLDPHANSVNSGVATIMWYNMLRSVSLPVLLPQTMLGSFVRASSCLIAWSISEYHK